MAETNAKTVKATKLKTKANDDVKLKEKKELSLGICNLQGNEEKKVSLPAEIFNVQSSSHLLAQYVRVYQVNQKQGNASAKTRSEVAGTTKKVYRQKGTGNARHGAVKAPIFVGGGVQGGPKPTDLYLKMNKKQKKKALFAALTQAYTNGNMIGVVDEILSIQPKTKQVSSTLKLFKLEKEKVLVVVPHAKDSNLWLALRNIKSVKIVHADMINPYMILNSKKILIAESGLQVIKDHFLKEHAAK